MMEAEKVEVQTVSELVYRQSKSSAKGHTVITPKDKYFLCYIVFFLLGILHFLPSSFLATANDFWLYKFRDVSAPANSTENRTKLQSYFASSQTVVDIVPAILLGGWNVLYGHRYRIVSRITAALIVITVLFYVLTSFIRIDTDNFQTVFFAITLTCSGLMTGATAINILTSAILYPRFPHSYMKICLIGEGVSSVLGDLLNIASLSIFESLPNATLIYFVSGSILITVTLILFVIISRSQFFRSCLDNIPETKNKRKPSVRALKSALRKIWPSVFIFLVFGLRTAATHTSVTSLVTSEFKGQNLWGTKYFTPVVTFLLSDIWVLLGRACSSYLPWKVPEGMLCVLSVMSSLLLVPGIWLCNANPRHHMPILFSHDWEYALLLGFLMFSNGYMINAAVINIPKKTSTEESEVAFNVFSLCMGVVQALVSPVGLVVINIL
ncbi:hypothetical protein GWI33_021498 [Rhynchophorus ferrugineus]|uniref:Equilibrative nucleoside transporter 3 n=1 Tax=Rhynchophorus ferrugineus TaxID=354439 RepID=A0A834IR96_RHYFE|nr:hypothetical protein GWI33_021498 [Rhynchophorus ferrugineus]